MNDAKLDKVAEILDQLIRLDIPGRGIIGDLYKAARRLAGQPLTLAAVNLLRKAIRPGDVVIIATGWVDQPVVAPGCGESDGPPGALALARSLRLALKAVPVILTDECLVGGIKQVAGAAGFQCVETETLIGTKEQDRLLTIAVLPFTADKKQARLQAGELMDRLSPAACIAIERGGENAAGIVHNMLGIDAGGGQAPLDALFQLAGERGIPTVGIGDGGNEIGMANIADTVKRRVPYGTRCQCHCGCGLATVTPVDVLITAAISNWGAYALAALLGVSAGKKEALVDIDLENRVLQAMVAAGFHDAVRGGVFPSVDGCAASVNLAMITLIRRVVLQEEKLFG